MERQSRGHFQFIAMFAVNCHRNSGEPRRNDRLDSAPVAGMHDGGSDLLHHANQARNIKLKCCALAASMHHSDARCPMAARGGGSTQSANVVFEQFGFETPDEL